jgi:hypothetical protein
MRAATVRTPVPAEGLSLAQLHGASAEQENNQRGNAFVGFDVQQGDSELALDRRQYIDLFPLLSGEKSRCSCN